MTISSRKENGVFFSPVGGVPGTESAFIGMDPEDKGGDGVAVTVGSDTTDR